MHSDFYRSSFYQVFLHGIFTSMGYQVRDPSFGRRNLPYHPYEITLREANHYWWDEEYLTIEPCANSTTKSCLSLRKKSTKQIYLQSWCHQENAEAPRAEIILLHGIAAYGGYLAKLVPVYTRLGYRVHIPDLPAHGRSDGIHGDLCDMQILLDALDTVVKKVRSYETKCPIFIMGYSLGGLIAIKYCIENPSSVSGLSLVSPCVMLNSKLVNNTALIQLGKIIAKITPRLSLPSGDNDNYDNSEEEPLCVNQIQSYSELHPQAKTSIENSIYEQDYVKRDPLMYQNSLRIGTLIMILNSTFSLPSQLPLLQIPFFVQQGAKDELLDINGVQMLYELSGSVDKLTRIYERLEHGMFNSDRVITDAIDWLESQVIRLKPRMGLSKA